MRQRKIGKKIAAFVLCLAMIFTAVELPAVKVLAAPIDSGKCGSNITWELNHETGVLTLTGTGSMYDMLPEDKYSAAPWESYASEIQQIIISEGITNIGDYTFCNENNLTAINFPKTVTSIGIGAFENCTAFEYFAIHDTVKAIKADAFKGMDSVYYSGDAVDSREDFWGAKKIITGYISAGGSLVAHFEDGVLTFEGKGEFNDTEYGYRKQPWIKYIDEIKEVRFLSDTKAIPGAAFQGFEHLSKVQFSPSIESIGASAFSRIDVFSLDVPDTVKSIGENAFFLLPNVNYSGTAKEITEGYWGARAVNGFVEGDLIYKDSSKEYLVGANKDAESVSISDNTKVIGTGAFMNNRKLQSVVIPDSVTQIKESAFEQCAELKDVKLSKKLTRIERRSFYECPNLNNVYCPDSLVNIDEYAFYGCDKLKNVRLNSGLKTIGESAFGAFEAKNTPLLCVPCSVESIEVDAFNGVSNVRYSGKYTSGEPWGAGKMQQNFSKEGHIDLNEDDVCDICGLNINNAVKDIEVTYSESVPATTSLDSLVPTLSDDYEYMIEFFKEDTNKNNDFFDDQCIVANDEMLEKYAKAVGMSKEMLLLDYEMNGITVKDSLTPGLNYSFCSFISQKGGGVLGAAKETILSRFYINGKEIIGYELGDMGWIDTSTLDVIIHAQKNATVTYEANGGLGTMEEEKLTLDKNNKIDFTFPACTFKAPAEKMFAGWEYYMQSNKKVVLQASEGDIREVTDDIVVYPVWKEHSPHNYTAEWKYDMSSHWKECECGSKADVATHNFGTGVITKPATEKENGVMTYTCSVCGQTKTETFSKEETPTPTPIPTAGPGVKPTPTAGPGVKPTPTAGPGVKPTPTAGPGVKPGATPTVGPGGTPPSENPNITVYKPAKVKILSAKNNKKKTIKIKIKAAKNAKKYKVQYATNKKFKKVKTITVKKLTTTLKKLKKKKTYYIRICGMNGKVKGPWSSVKKVKVNK